MPVVRVRGKNAGAAAAVMAIMATDGPEGGMKPGKECWKAAEKPSRGNPNQLSIKQHIFPKRSIERFANLNGKVQVHERTRRAIRLAKPQDQVFCTPRAWDQRAEGGYMKAIEDEFQVIAGEIVACNITDLAPDQVAAVSQFFALWYMRARYQVLPEQEVQLNSVEGDNLTKEAEETLEKEHYLYIRDGGRMPARMLNGLRLQRRIDDYAQQLSTITRWGIVRPVIGEFVVPDIPLATVIPLTPQLALTASSENGFVTETNLAEINQFMIANSAEYYFARDLASSPGHLPPAQNAEHRVS